VVWLQEKIEDIPILKWASTTAAQTLLQALYMTYGCGSVTIADITLSKASDKANNLLDHSWAHD